MTPINAMLYREAKIRFTNFAWVFWDLFYPLGYLLVFGVGINAALGSPFPSLEVDYNAFFLAGVLGMASFGIANNTAWGIFVDRDNGIFYEMLTYPLSRAEFLLGKTLFNVVLGLLQAAITVGLGMLLLRVPVRIDLLPLLLLGVVGGTAGWVFFYSIFALKIRRNDVFNTFTSFLYFLFLFASSMFYPLDPLPGWFRAAAWVNPITWHVDLLRYSSIGLGDPWQIFWESVAFVIFSVAAFAYAVRCLQQQN
jgi:ABC-2 type transport system permease protein